VRRRIKTQVYQPRCRGKCASQAQGAFLYKTSAIRVFHLFFFLWVKVVIYKQSNIGPFHIINKNIYFWRLNFNKSNFMKKILLLFAMFSSVLFAGAQNIQLLYNTGENQNNLTSTVEMFRPDKLGNTFFFIDFSYGAGEVEGVSSA